LEYHKFQLILCFSPSSSKERGGGGEKEVASFSYKSVNPTWIGKTDRAAEGKRKERKEEAETPALLAVTRKLRHPTMVGGGRIRERKEGGEKKGKKKKYARLPIFSSRPCY